MPSVRHVSESSLAESIMLVAEGRSLAAFGDACRRAIGCLTGSHTVGLYWLNGDVPQLFFSASVPAGLNEDYKTGLGKSDPFVDGVLHSRRVVDGRSLIGPYHWPRSTSYDFLRTWGFSYNMCGPLRVEDKIAGVFYTARSGGNPPYTADDRAGMELLCRAGSLALTNLDKGGVVDAEIGPPPAACSLPPARPLTASPCDRLPPRAADVAQLVCRGRSNKEIARALGISDQTVKDHVASLCRRFGALNRTELAARLHGAAAPR